MRHCDECLDDEKKDLLRLRAEEKLNPGLFQSTRSKTDAGKPYLSTIKDTSFDKIATGRVHQSSNKSSTSAFTVTVMDVSESMTGNGRTDEGSDESIVSSKFAECAILSGIGKITTIDKMSIEVALKNCKNAQSSTIYRSWTPASALLRLATGPLALVNVTFLVCDAAVAFEDLLMAFKFYSTLLWILSLCSSREEMSSTEPIARISAQDHAVVTSVAT